jgi:predicted DNA-binding protein (MmcQ/YjbR family)
MAKHCWVYLEKPDTLPEAELTERLKTSYELVVAKLPKKKRPPAP